MTKKSHPVGLRLGISSWPEVSWDLVNKETAAIALFLYRWLLGFCKRNYIYLVDTKLTQITRFHIVFFLFFFKPRKRSKRPRKLLLYKGVYMSAAARRRLAKRKKKVYKKSRFLQRKAKVLAFLLRRVKQKRVTVSSRFRSCFWFRKSVHGVKKSRLRRLFFDRRRRKRRYRAPRPIVFQRLQVLRLKQFIEVRLALMLNRIVYGLLINTGELFFFSTDYSSVNKKHYKFLRIIRKLSGRVVGLKRTVSQLFFLAALLARPALVHQWLYYYIMRVKKHHVIFSHQTFLRLMMVLCEGLVYYVGRLRGYKSYILGKVNGSERSQSHIYQAGDAVTNHTFTLFFAYSFQQIPTFAGALGCRLWFLYKAQYQYKPPFSRISQDIRQRA